MKDKWMNLGCEDDELKPYVEPEQDFKEPKRIGMFNQYLKIINSYLTIKILYVFICFEYTYLTFKLI